jgi:hypothetical protein
MSNLLLMVFLSIYDIDQHKREDIKTNGYCCIRMGLFVRGSRIIQMSN